MAVTYQTLIQLVQDRFRWWANPPLPARPTPALAGWTIPEWLAAAGVTTRATDERFLTQYPGTIDLGPYAPDTVAREALRTLVLEDEAEVKPGHTDVWRARPKGRHSV